MDETEPAGRTARAIVAAGMAAVAALFAFLFLYGDRQAATGSTGAWLFVGEVILFHGLGGLVAGAALAGLIGRRGTAGWRATSTSTPTITTAWTSPRPSTTGTTPGTCSRRRIPPGRTPPAGTC